MSDQTFTVTDLRSKMQDGEIDLSMMQLKNIPVKELGQLPQATSLDLSINLFMELPVNFCKELRHVVKLDLSKNKLSCLPRDIYLLEKLQHFDLYQNKLETLPFEFGRLNKLRWLDLKDNPLQEDLVKVVGDCLDDRQCKTCALNVVKHMKEKQSNKDREEQRIRAAEIELERERQKERDKEIEKERENEKARKKAEKEKRRREYERTQKKKVEDNEEPATAKKDLKKENVVPEKKHQSHWLRNTFLGFAVLAVAVAIGSYFYCKQNPKQDICKQSLVIVKSVGTQTKAIKHQAVEFGSSAFNKS